MAFRDRLRILALRDLRFVFSATLVSWLGDGIVQVALAFAVLDLTGSASDLGIVIAVRTIAQVAVLLFAGVVADRTSRRAVMMAADILRFGAQAAIGVLLLSKHATVSEFIVSQALVGIGSGFFAPASNGLLAAVAGDRLQSANALQSIATSASSLAGPAIGGVLVVAFGPSWALLLDATSYGLSAMFLSFVSREAASAHLEGAETPGSFLKELREGFSEVRSRTWAWSLIISMAISNSMIGSWEVLGPLMCKRHYGGAGAFALLSVLWAVGSLLGGFALLRFRPRRPLLAGTLACLPFSLPMILLALRLPLWAMAPFVIGAGFGPVMFNTLWWTALQQHVPKQSISRVIAYDYAGSYALQPVGYAAAGPLAVAVGLQPAMLIFAITAAVVVAASLLVKDVRNLGTNPPATDIVGA